MGSRVLKVIHVLMFGKLRKIVRIITDTLQDKYLVILGLGKQGWTLSKKELLVCNNFGLSLFFAKQSCSL